MEARDLTDLLGEHAAKSSVSASAGDLSRYAATYAWPDRCVDVTATASGLVIKNDLGERDAFPVDDRTFVFDAPNVDSPTVTFGSFDAAGRPQVLYLMLWGLPRMDR